MKILNILETAYRATLEEQDDTILWLSAALRNAGADLDVLLRSNAVSYLAHHECPPLEIGNVSIKHPAQPDHDILALQGKGARIFALREDLEQRGVPKSAGLTGVHLISRDDVPGLLEEYDQVWHW